jgi:hypothetical protein
MILPLPPDTPPYARATDLGIRRTSYGGHAAGLHTLAPDRHSICETVSEGAAMSLHDYVKKAWQDDMLQAAARDRLAAEALKARPAHPDRAEPARGRRTLRMLFRRAPA